MHLPLALEPASFTMGQKVRAAAVQAARSQRCSRPSLNAETHDTASALVLPAFPPSSGPQECMHIHMCVRTCRHRPAPPTCMASRLARLFCWQKSLTAIWKTSSEAILPCCCQVWAYVHSSVCDLASALDLSVAFLGGRARAAATSCFASTLRARPKLMLANRPRVAMRSGLIKVTQKAGAAGPMDHTGRGTLQACRLPRAAQTGSCNYRSQSITTTALNDENCLVPQACTTCSHISALVWHAPHPKSTARPLKALEGFMMNKACRSCPHELILTTHHLFLIVFSLRPGR